jgi:type IV pilus assembly protein PilQ
MRSFTIKYGVLKFLTVIAVVCLSWPIATAETEGDVVESGNDVTDAGSAVAETSNEASQEKMVLPDLKQRMQKRVFADHNDVSIDTVLRQLAEQADMDIIISPKVAGNVTVTLTDVPLEEALNNILAVHDCTYVLTDNMMRIITSEEMVAKAEPILTQTYEIVYIDAVQVVEALDKFKSPQGSVSSIKGTSHIIVTDTESKIREITALLDKIDRVTPQVLVEARIYDITSRDKLDLGVQWDVGQRTTFSESLGGANPEDEISPFSTGWFRGQTSKTGSDTVGALRFGWLNPNLDIDVLLRAEQAITNAKLLANPRILVLDNETALFDIVTEHPYVERTISEGSITETVNFKEVGVKLEVTPHVTRDGMLRLHILPEFGVFVERVTLATSDVPVVDTRKVNTIALVRDGQTVVLGGMRKKDVSKEVNKIPLLGDIPIIGGLFRFEGEDTSVTELIVFITPRIVLQEPVLSLDEQLAFEETKFSRPVPDSTRAEKEAPEDN